jgi:radical SAM superfamily enzyme YgiQ (UPF0313 family)
MMKVKSPLKSPQKRFHVVLIKPSKYDDAGYVISWLMGLITSNSLASMNALVEDVRDRKLLGPDVEIVIQLYDESVERVPIKKICRDLEKSGERGILLLAGVQTNQFARAVDLARDFRKGKIPAMIGGFHVSGCLAMLPDLPAEIRQARDEGITLVAGEVEDRMEDLLKAAYADRLKPVYDFIDDKPSLENAVIPFLPNRNLSRFVVPSSSVDAGRGCPFQCSFCAIINVQGNRMRGRTADDIEKMLRICHAQGIRHIFITDDNFARHKNWEEIVDRIIRLKEKEDLRFVLQIQIDMTTHRIPGFIEKLMRAGCNRIFLGLESVNPDNLKAAGKYQNRIAEYRTMLQQWHKGAITYAGYIIGFPGDTYESIMRDVEFLKREIPLDHAEFFIMTPLPGSKDHQKLYLDQAGLEPDTNQYDTVHICTKHPRMTGEEFMRAYHDAWKTFYSDEHMLTILKRQKNKNIRRRIMLSLVWFCSSIFIEKMHPLLGGFFRIKGRNRRRPGLAKENFFVYYAKRSYEASTSLIKLVGLIFKLLWIWHRATRAANAGYTDDAMTPAGDIPAPRS